MKTLSKSEAVKISELTSSIFAQGSSWVFREMDLKTGTVRLTRGLTQTGAKKRLKVWRREKIEELLRTEGSSKVYAIKSLHKTQAGRVQEFGVGHLTAGTQPKPKRSRHSKQKKKSKASFVKSLQFMR